MEYQLERLDQSGFETEDTLLYEAEITPPANPVKQGYTFTGWAGYTDGMTMPAEPVTFTAQWSAISSGGGGGTPTYSAAVEPAEHGAVRLSPQNASKGATVTITVTPDEGYVLDQLTVTGADGAAVALTKKSDTQYTFSMPASKVTVQASFVPEQTAAPLPFADVASDAWYYDAVAFVYGQGMMSGTGGDRFAPDMTLSRAMIAQVLCNLEENPAAGESAFTDVAQGTWYYGAVNWAAAQNIVTGYGDGTFGPEDNITREQMAAILYRYAQYKGYAAGTAGDLSAFTDGDQVSDWARTAMEWAVGSGVLSGKGNGLLDPTGTATRAEVAQILMNFCGAFVK